MSQAQKQTTNSLGHILLDITKCLFRVIFRNRLLGLGRKMISQISSFGKGITWICRLKCNIDFRPLGLCRHFTSYVGLLVCGYRNGIFGFWWWNTIQSGWLYHKSSLRLHSFRSKCLMLARKQKNVSSKYIIIHFLTMCFVSVITRAVLENVRLSYLHIR